jgi:hypothetical protein
MANYIDANILCQAYVHIDSEHIPEEMLDALQKELELFLATRGRFFLYNEVTTEVEFKSGSLKVYATIAGALYIAIGQYADFRSGVDYLAQDTKRLAECIASESLFMSQSRRDSIIRIEARTGVAGQLKTIVDNLESISSELNQVDADTSARKIKETSEKIEALLDNLKDPNDPAFVKDGLCTLIKSLLPTTPPNPLPPKRPHSSEFVAVYREERRRLLRAVSA